MPLAQEVLLIRGGATGLNVDVSLLTGTGTKYAGIFQGGSVGIGTASPDPSALLDITSTSKGALIPRMSTAQRTGISSPAAGLLVYDTTTDSFWYYDSIWHNLGSTSVGGPNYNDIDITTNAPVGTTISQGYIKFGPHSFDQDVFLGSYPGLWGWASRKRSHSGCATEYDRISPWQCLSIGCATGSWY